MNRSVPELWLILLAGMRENRREESEPKAWSGVETEHRQGGEMDVGVGRTHFGQTPAVRVYDDHASGSWHLSSITRLNRRAATRDARR